jgi:hypothetical protein
MRLFFCIHIGYHSLWYMIEEKITKLLDLKIEKYFFITFQYYSPVIAEIQSKYKDFTLIKVSKKGQDIGAFFVALINIFNRIDNIREDDIVFKLHTKSILDHFEVLLNSLFNNISNILSTFSSNREIGMIGSRNRIMKLSEDPYNIDKISKLCKELKILCQNEDKFIAGTIFAMRLAILYRAVDKNIKTLETFYNQLEDFYYINNKQCSTNIHSWERLYGIITRDQGYKILGI